jgi:hypothetical protein
MSSYGLGLDNYTVSWSLKNVLETELIYIVAASVLLPASQFRTYCDGGLEGRERLFNDAHCCTYYILYGMLCTFTIVGRTFVFLLQQGTANRLGCHKCKGAHTHAHHYGLADTPL